MRKKRNEFPQLRASGLGISYLADIRQAIGALSLRQKVRQTVGRSVHKPVVLGNGELARRYWQYPDPFSELVLIHYIPQLVSRIPVTIAETGKLLTPVIVV
ncbi:MAG: hypothetical protein WCI51_19075 [Lentisphaerota bacterium]